MNYLPSNVRFNLLRNIFDLPLPIYKTFIQVMTAPTRAQKRWIKSAQADGWKGSWYAKGAADVTDVDQWASEASTLDFVLLWIHGGGYCVGSDTMYSLFCIKILEHLKSSYNMSGRILSVDYTLSPEAKYPTQRDECINCYKYLVETLGVSPAKIIIGGDSAGRNCIAVILQAIQRDILPATALLVSPWINFETTSPTYLSNVAKDCIGIKNLNNCIARYVPEGMDISDPAMSPVHAESFKGLPPFFVACGDYELFKHDIQTFIRRSREDGVEVEVITREMPHIWVMAPDIPGDMSIWEEDVVKITDWCASKVKPQ